MTSSLLDNKNNGKRCEKGLMLFLKTQRIIGLACSIILLCWWAYSVINYVNNGLNFWDATTKVNTLFLLSLLGISFYDSARSQIKLKRENETLKAELEKNRA